MITADNSGWPLLRRRVFTRDGNRCQAPLLDPSVSPQDCRNRWGQPAVMGWRFDGSPVYREDSLTQDHVHWHAGGTRGKKPPDDEAHLVTICWHHHLDGWATRSRELERAYLRELYPEETA